MKKFIWIIWGIITLILGSYFYYLITQSNDKSALLIGDTTYGHYQIEMACETCHSDPFGGEDVLQNACVQCHEQELENAHDSHPKKKFTDPREAYRLEIIDARYCINCHTEHHKDRTLSMGLTLPDDYCYHCHQEIGDERESHKDLPFDSCATSGCHNYHDNRALYEAFLVEHANEPELKDDFQTRTATILSNLTAPATFPDDTAYKDKYPQVANNYLHSAHDAAQLPCTSCHIENDQWVDTPSYKNCETCHQQQVQTYTEGKHGMRLSKNVAHDLDALKVGNAQLSIHEERADELHGCNSCHGAHTFDTQAAAVSQCLTCHNDNHSNNFLNSKHGNLWNQFIDGDIEKNKTVTCATCHMPKTEIKNHGISTIYTNHNQNDNLRPNEKMIRTVCLDCHGLQFSLNALADEKLIENNFSGRSGIHIESIDWSVERIKN